MIKIAFRSVLLIAVVALVSAGCTKQKVSNETAKDSFASWNEDINMLTCDILAPTMHFSRWLNAPEENQYLAFLYFNCLNPYNGWTNTVQEVQYFQKIAEDTWKVSYQSTSMLFHLVQGSDIFSQGCIMETTLSDNAESKNPFVNHTITIENIGDNSWAVSCLDDENCRLQGTVTKNDEYAIEISESVSFSGTGRVRHHDPASNTFVTMEFETSEPFVWKRAFEAETSSFLEFGCPWWNTEGTAKRDLTTGGLELIVSNETDDKAASVTVTGKNQIQVNCAGLKRSWEIEPY